MAIKKFATMRATDTCLSFEEELLVLNVGASVGSALVTVAVTVAVSVESAGIDEAIVVNVGTME